MSRLQQIIDILRDEKPKVDGGQTAARKREVSEKDAIETIEAFCQTDPQKAFRDTLAVLKKQNPEDFSKDVSNALRQAVCLAREAYSVLLPGPMTLKGFVFSREGYYPCCLTLTRNSISMGIPRDFASGRLTAWPNGCYSREAVATCARGLLELYNKQAASSRMTFGAALPTEEIAESILRALDAMED